VQISLAEWNQIKGEFQMVCFAGIMAGNNRQSVDSKILAGMNDIGKEVYLSAYRSGSEYPKPRSKNNTEKVMLQQGRKRLQRRKQMHPENKVPPTKQSRLTIINPRVFALTPPIFNAFSLHSEMNLCGELVMRRVFQEKNVQ
jgi:colicin import membrane protein